MNYRKLSVFSSNHSKLLLKFGSIKPKLLQCFKHAHKLSDIFFFLAFIHSKISVDLSSQIF